MKRKLILPIIVTALIIGCQSTKTNTPSEEMTTDSNQTSPGWPVQDGAVMYRGTLPCADCEGILTKVTLNPDTTYRHTVQYLGKSDSLFRQTGSFTWDKAKNEITLEGSGAPAEAARYRVGEDELITLDQDGNRIEGELADAYRLKKVLYDATIVEKYWKLVTLYGQPVTMGEDQEREVHFILKNDDRVNGYSGCNALTGNYRLDEGYRIQFTDIAVTMRICPQSETERKFLDVLNTTDNYSHSGDTLTLNKARMAPLAVFEAVYLD